MCPNCKNLLSETTNTFKGEVFQRVISCDNCGYVYSFDATEEESDQLTDYQNELRYAYGN